MIDRHHGYLARDGREHAIRLLDTYADIKGGDVQALDVRWTPQLPIVANQDNGNSAITRSAVRVWRSRLVRSAASAPGRRLDVEMA
jgi:hypothetical protein